MYKKVTMMTGLMLLAVAAWGQRKEAAASDTSRWDFHLSTGATAVTFGGHGDAYLWVAPRVEYRASDRLTVGGGFGYTGSLLNSYELRGNQRSLAPRRTGTRLFTAYGDLQYRASDRLSLWAEVSHTAGWYTPLWGSEGHALSLGLTSFSGGLAYELSDESFLELHFHIVHDQYGNAARGLFGHPYYGPGVPSLELW